MEKLIADIKALRERLEAIDQRQAEIEAECDTKHSGKFTPELRTEHDALSEEYAAKDESLAELESDLKRLQSRKDRKLSDTPLPRRTSAGSAAPLPVADDGVRVAIPANVRRGTQLQSFKGERDGQSAEERAYRFGMLMLAKASMDLPGKFRFQQAIDFCREQFALSSETGPDFGSVLVQQQFGQDLIDLREQYGIVRQLFKRRTMTSDTRTDPRRGSGLTAYFVGEGAAGTESTKEWNQVRLTAKKLMVISRYTSELNMDSVISIGDDLANEIAYAFAEKEDDCGINGDGTAGTYGRITGVRAALGAAAGSPTTTSAGGIIVGAGNAYSELTLANFHSVVGILPQYADTPRTHWLVHKVFWSTVMQRLAFAQGGVTTNEVQGGGRYEFLGYPVKISQKMPSTEANSQVCALLGDFTLGASFGDRSLDSIDFSTEAYVNSQSLWESDEIGIRGTERFDINVHDVGTTSAAGPIVGLQTLNG